MIKFVYNDGGRTVSGFKGHTGDCVTRAIAIATNTPYLEVYQQINEMAKAAGDERTSARTGVFKKTQLEIREWLAQNGWKWVPVMGFGTGCTMHVSEKELPKGNLILRLSKHYAAVIDGVLHDTHDCSRNGTRCVYGYFIKQ